MRPSPGHSSCKMRRFLRLPNEERSCFSKSGLSEFTIRMKLLSKRVRKIQFRFFRRVVERPEPPP